MTGPAGAAMGDIALEDLFDADYLRFWAPELEGERLTHELEVVQRLGNLSSGDRVLDIACGFGRIAVGLARAGIDITGVDLSPALLEQARRRGEESGVALQLLSGDMRELGELGEFDCALLWFTSFGYFGDDDDRRVLGEALRCLVPGGRLLIETRHWDRANRRFEPTTVRSAGKDLLIERHRYDPLTGVQHTAATLIVDGVQRELHSWLRRYSVPELRSLCLQAGFASVSAFDGNGEELTPESERCVLVAEK